MRIAVKRIRPDAVLPAYARPGDSGFDLVLADDIEVPANGMLKVQSGLAFEIPEGFEMQLRLRSSTAKNYPLIIPNAPGTVDSGYRGEVAYILRNLSDRAVFVEKGKSLVQGVIAPVARAGFHFGKIGDTPRGSGGFGSTGE